MPQLIKHGELVADRFVLQRDAQTLADLPDATPVIVPLALWRGARAALVARGEVGVLLAPGDDPAELAGDLKQILVIAIDFPSFTDGRGYSSGRLLRERFHFAGELRAVGDIGRDQLHFLHQCGFDAFDVADGGDARDALAGLADFTDGYQATALRAPRFDRRTAGTPPGDVWFPCA
jgi:uncharacterized protein (DUF934 family)